MIASKSSLKPFGAVPSFNDFTGVGVDRDGVYRAALAKVLGVGDGIGKIIAVGSDFNGDIRTDRPIFLRFAESDKFVDARLADPRFIR